MPVKAGAPVAFLKCFYPKSVRLSKAVTSKESETASGISGLVARALRESALFVLGALGLILLVALISFDPADASFSTTGEPGPVANWQYPQPVDTNFPS